MITSLTEQKESLMNRLKLGDFETYLRFPLFFELETINACNARCTMCTVNDWKPEGSPLMHPDIFKRIADEIIEHKDIVRTVNLSRDGEPLMDKGLEDKIRYFKQHGVNHVTFSTNASLMSEKRARTLLESGLKDIMFSIDGYKAETFEMIREGLVFDTVVTNVENFIRLRDESYPDVRIRVRMVLQKENEEEVDNWGKFWRDRLKSSDSVHAKKVHSWGNQLDTYTNKVVDPFDPVKTPCTSTFSTMVIKYNGQVMVCPLDYNLQYPNGNIMESSIADIWRNGEGFKKFREVHLGGERDNFAFCKGCRLWDSDISKKVF